MVEIIKHSTDFVKDGEKIEVRLYERCILLTLISDFWHHDNMTLHVRIKMKTRKISNNSRLNFLQMHKHCSLNNQFVWNQHPVILSFIHRRVHEIEITSYNGWSCGPRS